MLDRIKCVQGLQECNTGQADWATVCLLHRHTANLSIMEFLTCNTAKSLLSHKLLERIKQENGLSLGRENNSIKMT
jgi:hypothetical protein